MAGNARFHNKWHRRSHHSLPSTGYPDSGTDPIASPQEPFVGDFVLTGNLSAHGNATIDGDTTIWGNLSVLGDLTYLDTVVSVTSSLSVVNHGEGPAVTVEQYGDEPIARFIDPDAPGGQKFALSIENDGYVVIDGITPAEKYDSTANNVEKMSLTINGNGYATKSFIYEKPDANSIYVSTTGSDLNTGLNPSQKVKTIKKAAKIAFDLYGPNKCAIYVEAGDYTEINPIYIPAGTTVLGDGYLRRVTVRPYHRQLDLFWLNTACYMWGFTFRDLLEPCAATAFPNLLSGTPAYRAAFQTPGYEINVAKPGGSFGLPIVSKPYVTTSPYTQGMSSITKYLTVPIEPEIYNAPFPPGAQVIDLTKTTGGLTSAYILSSFNIITKIILGGPSVAPLSSTFAVPVGTADAVSLINSNTPPMQEAVVAYISRKYPTFAYNVNSCYRDVGIIMEGITKDLTNGNTLCAIACGKAYYNGTQSRIAGQELQTVDALEYANSLVQKVITNTTIPIYEQQFNNSLTLGAQSSAYIATDINIINSIIRTGIAPTPVTFTPPPTDGAYLLNLNRAFIGKTVINYISKTFPGFFYNQAKCERDAGLIVEALVYDLTNGTTLCAVAAGTCYYNGGQSLIRGQETQTIAAINYINTLSQSIITNTIAITSQSFNPFLSSGRYAARDVEVSFDTVRNIILTNDLPPVTGNPQYYNASLTLGGYTSAYVLSTYQTVIKAISSGPSSIPPLVTFPIPYGASNATNLLNGNRSYLQGEVIDFVSTDYPSLRYNRDIFNSDVGLLVDAVNWDLTYGTNASARAVSQQYYRGGTSRISGQEKQTMAAINYLNTLSQRVITNKLIDSRSNAVSLLRANKTFIQKETIQYVNKTYPSFSYNQAKCERDIGYIIDAVIYDVTNNTNASAVEAGNFYVNGAVVGQEIETVQAIGFAKRLALQIIRNEPVENIPAGCGIRVDGSLALGFLRSFVTDSFTQFNAGGKGIHIINCGYAQLVSTFTICTTEGVMTESGGQCSISTSNCSFGLSGLVAVGKSKFPVLTGYQYQTTPLAENYLIVQDVTPRPLSAFVAALQAGKELEGIPIESPYNGLLATVQNDPSSNYSAILNPTGEQTYHGIKAVSALPAPYPLNSYRLTLERNIQAPLTASNSEPKYVEFWLRSQIASSSHAFEYIGTGVDLELAVPALGGKPVNDNEAVYSDKGIVYYSSTNERGDFKVGGGFKIVQEKGSVEGLDFNKSILALVTPLILTIA
jgi:hypothetical protein